MPTLTKNKSAAKAGATSSKISAAKKLAAIQEFQQEVELIRFFYPGEHILPRRVIY